MVSKYDWTTFTKRINIKAEIEEIYLSFSTQIGMESWFLRLCEYSHANGEQITPGQTVFEGDSYSWYWFGYSDEVNENGKILIANDKDHFAFTFDDNGNTEMKVEVKIYEEKSQAIVELRQYDIPDDEASRIKWHVGCMEGWTFYLSNLKSILEGGLDLRNKDEDFKRLFNC